MFGDMLGLLEGAALMVGLYLLYIGLTKGAPAVWDLLKSWWTKGETRLQKIEADIVALKAKLGL